jgi:sugar lactone lactonase YvrE
LVGGVFLLLNGGLPLAAQATYTPYRFTTFAGTAGGLGAADGTGAYAQFYQPFSVAVNGSGNLYVADSGNHTIRKITPAGVVTTFAGTAGSAGSVDGNGMAARFRFPRGVAVDGNGNVYVADTSNHAIRKISSAGDVTTLAGSAGAAGSADGMGVGARFNHPHALAVDASGNVYVADSLNHSIRKISPAGDVTTFAGGSRNVGNADGTGTAAQFNQPHGLAMDVGGTIYVADTYNHTIRKITPAGLVTTLAGMAGISGSDDGSGAEARFNYPWGIAVGGDGHVYVADQQNNSIRKITPTGVVTTLAGLAGSSGFANGAGAAARFDGPYGVAADGSGNVYVADTANLLIRKITAAGMVTTLAGKADNSGSADGDGASAQFAHPYGVATDGGGNVYVADASNFTVRKISSTGIVTTLAGMAGASGSTDGVGVAARFSIPWGLAVDGGGNVFVADSNNRTIRKITTAGVVTTFVGAAGVAGSADGTGAAARFLNPSGLATDGSGNLYVTDTSSSTIRKITAEGIVTTLAGTASAAGSIDGLGAAARFRFPSGLAVDASGNIFVADTNNHTIRKITPAGMVTTLAGTAGVSGSADGTGAAARFFLPCAVAMDPGGNVYVADTGNHTIRKVTSGGVVTTLGGWAGDYGSVDGTGGAARFDQPYGVAIDGSGNLYVADAVNNLIRRGVPAQAPLTIFAQPSNQSAGAGQSATLSISTSGTVPSAYQWTKDGVGISGGSGNTLTLAGVQPATTGLYAVTITDGATTVTSDPTILGVTTASEVIGAAEVLSPTAIRHPNGGIYDQVLLEGPAAAITSNYGASIVTRISFIDLTNDIVQVELFGPGTLSLVLDNPTGPAVASNYNQPSVNYMKGHVGIVVTGATEATNLSVFSLGRATAFDPTGAFNFMLPIDATNNPANNGSPLFVGQAGTVYDGVADVAFIAIASVNGKFGGLRAANANFYAAKGVTGVYAPKVAFQGPVFIGDITASDTATPMIVIGSSPDTRITGGDLLQANSQPVKVAGLTRLNFTAGSDSHGHLFSAKNNRGTLMQDGVDVTAQVVVNPAP